MKKLLVLAISFFVLASCEDDKLPKADLFSGVPQSTVFLIETNDFKANLRSLDETQIFKDLDSLPLFLNKRKELTQLLSLFNEEELNSFFNDRTVLTGIAPSGAEKYDLFFLSSGLKSFEKSIFKALSAAYSSEKKIYSEVELTWFYKDESSESLYFCSHRGVLILSSNINLIEGCIRQINSGLSIKQDAEFSKLYRTSNKKDLANIYFNFNGLPNWLNTKIELGTNTILNRMGSWAELDVQLYDKELIMSGVGLLPDEGAYYPSIFSSINPQSVNSEKIIPSNFGLWVSFSFENAGQYYRKYRDYLNNGGNLIKHDDNLTAIGLDSEKTFLNWMDNEMGLFYTGEAQSSKNIFAYFKFLENQDCSNSLENISDSLFIEGYRGFIIKKLDNTKALPRLFGRAFKDFERPYYFIGKEFVIFGNDLPNLKGVVNDYLSEKTLSRENLYKDFKGRIPAKSHIKVLASNPRFLDVASSLLSRKDIRTIDQHRESLNHYKWASLQLTVEDNASLINFYMVHQEEKKEEVNRVWTTVLESPLANTPQLLINHRSKKRDIVVQDKDYRFYLLDANGKILWKRTLDGPIMGSISQIDIYKNNKLQMVFNTPKSLYILDRLGNDIDGFPIALKEAASAPVGVFDYDENRKYRLVVPCGRMAYNYGIDGKLVKGWKFKKSEANLISQPQHFAVAGKDVIITLSEDGKLFQLNRRGEERFKADEKLPALNTPFFLQKGETLKESKLIATNQEGELYAIHPQGTIDHLYIDEDYPAQNFLYFNDKYIFTYKDLLFVKDDTNPWKAELQGPIDHQPKAMIYKGAFYAAAFSEEAEEIRLYTNEGKLVKGFPVFAQAPFDIGSLKQNGILNIVTASSDGTLICYQVD